MLADRAATRCVILASFADLRPGSRRDVDACRELGASPALRIAPTERAAVRASVDRLSSLLGVELASRAIGTLAVETAIVLVAVGREHCRPLACPGHYFPPRM